MRDIIFTLIAAWVVYKIIESINAARRTPKTPKEGETKINYTPPTKKPGNNKEGEYVDYEEIK